MKKIVALVTILSLVAINCATVREKRAERFAQEQKPKPRQRQGAQLIVQKIDGQQVKGELIAIKENSLLLLDRERADVSVDISNISVITIVKESKAGLGLLFGFVGGVIVAAFTTPSQNAQNSGGMISVRIPLMLLVPSVGWMLGALAGADETIEIEGKSDSEVKGTLQKLRSKTRIPDYQ